MFLFYDNFAGTSLNTSKWNNFIGSNSNIEVNNGITINSYSYAGIITLSGFNPTSTIADIYITYAYGNWPVISMTIGNSASSNGYFSLLNKDANYYYGSYSVGLKPDNVIIPA